MTQTLAKTISLTQNMIRPRHVYVLMLISTALVTYSLEGLKSIESLGYIFLVSLTMLVPKATVLGQITQNLSLIHI